MQERRGEMVNERSTGGLIDGEKRWACERKLDPERIRQLKCSRGCLGCASGRGRVMTVRHASDDEKVWWMKMG